MAVFYHATMASNLGSIRANGLVPRIGPLSADFGEHCPAVYLFSSADDADNALMNWLGEAFDETYGEDAEAVLLRIEAPEGTLQLERTSGYEISCYDVIAPEYIAIEKYV